MVVASYFTPVLSSVIAAILLGVALVSGGSLVCYLATSNLIRLKNNHSRNKIRGHSPLFFMLIRLASLPPPCYQAVLQRLIVRLFLPIKSYLLIRQISSYGGKVGNANHCFAL